MAVLVVDTGGGRDTGAAVVHALSGHDDALRRADAALGAAHPAAPSGPRSRRRHLRRRPGAGHRACRAVRAATSAQLCLMSSSRREADELLAFARGCDDYISISRSSDVLWVRLEVLAARGPEPRAAGGPKVGGAVPGVGYRLGYLSAEDNPWPSGAVGGPPV